MTLIQLNFGNNMRLRQGLTAISLATAVLFLGNAAAAEFKMISVDKPGTVKKGSNVKVESRRRINTTDAEIAWRAWMTKHHVTKSSLAIGFDGKILRSSGYGRRADVAYPMASLAKAVTGMCLNQILKESPYSWESTLKDLAPEFSRMNFTPATAMADLTLTQIATHTSGLPERLKYGKTSKRATTLNSQPKMTKAALNEAANFGRRGKYVYSNANYAILGSIIEAITGQTYGHYCSAKIMKPAGATHAGVTGSMSHTAGYGGWSVSVEDYSRFAMHWFAPDRPWMQTPANFPYEADANYGMGTSVYRTGRGTFVSHYGKWTQNEPGKPNIGALFFVREDGVVVVANWEGSLEISLYDELHYGLSEALR